MGKAVLSSMQYFFTCLWPSCCLALILTKEGGEKELSKHSWLESVGGGRRKHISVTARSVSFYWRMTIQSHGACKKYIHRVVHWHFLQSQPTYFVREMCISWSLFLVHTVEVLACKHIPIIYICKFFFVGSWYDTLLWSPWNCFHVFAKWRKVGWKMCHRGNFVCTLFMLLCIFICFCKSLV